MEPVDAVERIRPVAVDEATRGLLNWLRAVDAPDRLDGYSERLAGVARALTEAGAEALEASRVIAMLNDALTGRLLALAEAELGPLPCPYAWLVLGSEGRMEQALLTDQDNALVYATDKGLDDDTAQDYFATLAERVVTGLLRAGFPLCPGGYMATNWRRALPAWEATIRDWVEGPDPQRLVEAEVFLDFRKVHGALDLDPLDAILRTGADRPHFLILMARAAVKFPPPLWLGRIRGRDHQVDVKRGGLAAIVLLARLYAVAGRSTVRPTPVRLRAAAQAGTLSRLGAARLTAAYRLLADLRLRAQLRKVAAGQPPDNLVALDELGPGEREGMRTAFQAVRDVQNATALRFHTDTVT